jgi:polyisoprenyl-phosphate glycosyltransferase
MTDGPMTRPFVVVTPIFEDAQAAAHLFGELAKVSGGRAYIVAVDDGSVRHPVDPGCIEETGLNGVVIRLRRNVGHQRAIAVGLHHVAEHLRAFDRVVVMDSDGEDLPASIGLLLQDLESTDVDIAVAQRRSRVESLRFRLLYWVYKRLFELLVGRRIAFGNFIALRRSAAHRLVAMSELWIHLPGCVLCSKLRIASRPIDRGPRYIGRSKMNFVALALHGFKGLMVFSEDVLVRAGIACTVVAIVSVLGSVLAVAMKFTGHTTPGWSTVVLGVLMLVFLQMGALTLMMLMLTGLMRANTVTSVAYEDFIEARHHVSATGAYVSRAIGSVTAPTS